MNNIQQQIDIVSRLPDDVLLMKAQKGDPSIPQWAFVSEIDDRTRTRKASEASQQEQPKVAQRVVQEGIAALQPSQPQRPMGMQQPMQQPQGMYAGGTVRMQRGGFLGNMMGDLMNYSGPEIPRNDRPEIPKNNLIQRDFNFLDSEPQPRDAYISDGERVDASVLDPAKIFIDNITRAREMGVPESQLVDTIRSQFGDTAGDQAAQIYSSLNDVQVRPVIESMTSDAIPLSTIEPTERELAERKTPLGAIARAVSSPFQNAPQDFDDTTSLDQIFADVQNVKTPISEGEFMAAGAMPTSMQSALLAAESPTNIRLPTKVDEDGEKIDDPLGALVADASNFQPAGTRRREARNNPNTEFDLFEGLFDRKAPSSGGQMGRRRTGIETLQVDDGDTEGAGVNIPFLSNANADTTEVEKLIASATTGTGTGTGTGTDVDAVAENAFAGLPVEVRQAGKEQADSMAGYLASQTGNNSSIDKQVLSNALMYIGAGLMKNDLAGGIENAAKAATGIREKEADRALQQEYYDTRRAEASRDQAFRLSAADQADQIKLATEVRRELIDWEKSDPALAGLKISSPNEYARRRAAKRAELGRSIGSDLRVPKRIVDTYIGSEPASTAGVSGAIKFDASGKRI